MMNGPDAHDVQDANLTEAPEERSNRDVEDMPPAAWAFFAVYAVTASVLAFGDIGFDHPGRFGLDSSHLVILGLVLAIATMLGVVVAVHTRSSRLAAVIVSGFLLNVVALLVGG